MSNDQYINIAEYERMKSKSLLNFYGRKIFETFTLNRLPSSNFVYFGEDSHYDAILNVLGNQYLVEIKYRHSYSSDRVVIKDEGCMIELKKWDYLFRDSTYLGIRTIYYVCIFRYDQKMFIYNLTDIRNREKIITSETSCPLTSEFGNRSYLYKNTISLPLSWGKEYNLSSYDFKALVSY